MAKVARTQGAKQTVAKNAAIFMGPGFLPALKSGIASPHVAAYNRGVECAADGLFDEAIASYQEAIARKVDFLDAHYNLGLALWRTDRLTEATSAFLKVISIAPGDADFRNAIGMVYVRRGLWIEAIDALLMAVHLNPNHGSAWFNLAATYEANNQLELAVDTLSTAASIARSSETVTFIGFMLSFAVHLCKRLQDRYNEQTMGYTAEQLSVVAKSGLSAAELQEAIDNYKAAKAQFTARGKPSRAKAEPRGTNIKLSPSRVVAVIEDATLGRLHRRYTELLEKIELPPDGFKSLRQARAGALLSSTFNNLQARRAKVGLEPLPKDERVAEAKRLSVAFYRHKAQPKSSRRSRTSRGAALG